MRKQMTGLWRIPVTILVVGEILVATALGSLAAPSPRLALLSFPLLFLLFWIEVGVILCIGIGAYQAGWRVFLKLALVWLFCLWSEKISDWATAD